MSNKTKNILKWIPSMLVMCILTMTAIMKLIEFPPIFQMFEQMGLEQYMKIFACMELTFLALFLFQGTMKTGLLLFTAYYGGAIATEFIQHGTMIAPAIILCLIWIAAYVRNTSVLKEKETERNTFIFS